jgi:hypothetical protein
MGCWVFPAQEGLRDSACGMMIGVYHLFNLLFGKFQPL